LGAIRRSIMDLPRVRKQLWDLLPAGSGLANRARSLGSGLLVLAIGAFASPAQPAVQSPGESAAGSSKMQQEAAEKLILQQPTAPSSTHAQHESHWSHSSHESHASHYSHYSSR